MVGPPLGGCSVPGVYIGPAGPAEGVLRSRPVALEAASARPDRLSKSRAMAGLQCDKLLWWMAHEPAAPELEVDEGRQALYDQGHRVGGLAGTYVPGGVLVDLPYAAYEERLEATRQALAEGAPAIYEAAFRADGVFVSVDILERLDRGFCLIEVKSTAGVKEHHLPDVAGQTPGLRPGGLGIHRKEGMHLHPGCPGSELSQPITTAHSNQLVEVRPGSGP